MKNQTPQNYMYYDISCSKKNLSSSCDQYKEFDCDSTWILIL